MIVSLAERAARRAKAGTEFGLRLAATFCYETNSFAARVLRSRASSPSGSSRRSSCRPGRFGRARPKGASRSFRRRTSASTSRGRRWSSRSIRCRARSFRSSISTAIRRLADAPSDVNMVGDSMAPLNLQVMVNANGTPASALQPGARGHRGQPLQGSDGDVHRARPPRIVGPGSAQKIAAQLEADVKAGALGLGEIMKNFGLYDQESRRHAAAARRSGARPGLGEGGAT